MQEMANVSPEHILKTTKYSGLKKPNMLSHKERRNIPKHTASNPKTQGLKWWS